MDIIGRLTRDAEVKTLDNGKQVVNFSVAVDDSYKNKQGERVKRVEFFNCSYWRTPNVVKMLTKGLLVALTGRVSASAWINKDGEPKAALNFHTSDIKPLAGSRNAAMQQDTATAIPVHPQPQEAYDDLPF